MEIYINLIERSVKVFFNILVQNVLYNFVLQFYVFKDVNIQREFINQSFFIYEFSVFIYLILKYCLMEFFYLFLREEEKEFQLKLDFLVYILDVNYLFILKVVGIYIILFKIFLD